MVSVTYAEVAGPAEIELQLSRPIIAPDQSSMSLWFNIGRPRTPTDTIVSWNAGTGDIEVADSSIYQAGDVLTFNADTLHYALVYSITDATHVNLETNPFGFGAIVPAAGKIVHWTPYGELCSLFAWTQPATIEISVSDSNIWSDRNAYITLPAGMDFGGPQLETNVQFLVHP